MKKYDVTALGEILIDMTYAGKSEAGQTLFEQNPGGAPANVLAAVSRLGGKCAFIGKRKVVFPVSGNSSPVEF